MPDQAAVGPTSAEPAGDGLAVLRHRHDGPRAVPGATGTSLPSPPSTGAEVTITIDGRQVSAREGEVLIAAAERAGTYIPRFCYHPRMKPVGMCRMCLVEVKGPRGYSLSPACYLPVTEGLEVLTDSPRAKKAQEGVLEFLLVNHPLDCPVCDKGGECPLQDQTVAYGPGETRFIEEKRHWDKPVPISPLILIDRERCIQCARCTRFAEEVAGDPLIDFFSRGDSTEVAISPEQPFSSNFSGNIVQICPVGALLAKPYRFKARPWDLEQVETTCTYCAVGCRTVAQSSANEVVRFIGVDNDRVNWGWLCDKGRFGFEALNSSQRLSVPLLRRINFGDGRDGEGELSEASWAGAMSAVAEKLAGLDGRRVGVIGGARLPNEDAYAWAKFARTCLQTSNIDAQLGDGLSSELVASLPRATLEQACKASLVITLAPDLKEELPVAYLRLRHAVTDGRVPLVEISPSSTGLSSLAALRLHYRPGELGGLVAAMVGDRQVTGALGGVSPEDIELARLAVREASGKVPAGAANGGQPAIVVVLGRPSLAEPSKAIEQAARTLGQLPGVAFLPALRRSNVNGAIDMGLAPGLLPGRSGFSEAKSWYERHWGTTLAAGSQMGTLEMLQAAAAGDMDVLFLLGADPLADFPDQDLAARALDRAGFVVSVDSFVTASVLRAADVVLPVAMYTERHGSFTNFEGRVSWLAQKVTPPGTAWSDWEVAAELASRLGKDLGFGCLEDIWAEVERVSPLHRGVPHAALVSPQGRDGVVVPLGREDGTGPRPLDPMANPGIAPLEPHAPALPEPLGAANGLGSVNAAPKGPAGPAEAGPTDREPVPPMLRLAPPRSTAGPLGGEPPKPSPGTLLLVTARPMWDGGTLVQASPSLCDLHPPLVVRANPRQLEALGVEPGAQVRLSSGRGSMTLQALADPGVPSGVAVVPFNLPEGGAGQLIDAAKETTEVRIEPLGAVR
ncbi:MAG: NADH-quinone oxidoreductase subunit NuoG [Acidimicrobiales bacterium]